MILNDMNETKTGNINSAKSKKEEEQRLIAIIEAAKEKNEKLEAIKNDPFLGYETFDDAINDYKITSQAEVLARLFNKENLFISGPAGSGKTTVINRFKEWLETEYDGNVLVAVTASTGIAATLIGGKTIHSWAGLGISTEPFNPKKLDPQFFTRRKDMAAADVLIIDEISMLPAYLLEKLDLTLKHARRNKKPFGGIQVVFIGDFLQLPPVSKSTDEVNTDFAIATDAWKEADIKYCYMDKTHRATDKKLKFILAAMAINKVDGRVRALVNNRIMVDREKDKVYTTLFTMNKNVDAYNEQKLNENPNPVKIFYSKEHGERSKVEKIYKANNISELLRFKNGATVILTSNINDLDQGIFLANGSIGVILEMRSDYIKVRFNSGITYNVPKNFYPFEEEVAVYDEKTGGTKSEKIVTASVEQIPLKLGYAITVHKSQGQTFDGVVVDLSKCFTPGLGYVALSRVRTLDDLIITGFSEKAYDINERSLKISRYAKKKAHLDRKKLIENKEHYQSLLDNTEKREMKWTKKSV